MSEYCKNCYELQGQLDRLKAEIKEIAKEYMGKGQMISGGWLYQKISEYDVENEYNTKDIRHINENNQKYIAENNRMTKNNLRRYKCI